LKADGLDGASMYSGGSQMIFKFFKREPPPPAAKVKAAPRRKVKGDTTMPMLPPEPSTLEVTEGSTHSDWELWEDSVAALDSQMSTLQPSARRHRHEPETPTEFQDIEAFATVRHKDP
jgi:hypothetical protein